MKDPAAQVLVALSAAAAAWLAAGWASAALGMDGWWPLDRLGAVFLVLWALEKAQARAAHGAPAP